MELHVKLILAQVSLSYSQEVLSHVWPWNLADSRL